MSSTPPRKTEANQRATATRLMLIGGVVVVIGLLILVLLDTPAGIPVMVIGALPVVAGIALIASSTVSKRSREGKDWA
jgi:uncharacterized membrane protein HdeD (DUF308 family)